MTARTRELLTFLDDQRRGLRDAVSSVALHDWYTRPAPDRWSVAEVLEHVGLVESRVTMLLASRLAAAKVQGGVPADPGEASALGTTDLDRMTNRRRKVVAGDAAQPTGGVTIDDAWRLLEDTLAAACAVVREGDGWALDGLVAPHPALGRLDFYQWIGFLGGHEARHALQVREIGDALRASATE
jgi:hypothetical protein